VLTPGGDDDSGAFGVLLNGDRTDVANNTISGHDAFSYDYGRDGAAVDVYGGQANHIHHNLAIDNETFSELGNSRSRDNTYAYNVVRSSLNQSFFLVTRGSRNSFGPVANTKLVNNTVVMTGSGSQGFVCHAGCNSSILTMRNNVIQAVAKVGFADGSFDEDYNLYYGGKVQFNTGSHTMVANPMFVNVAAGDLHVNSGSPARDSGVDSGYSADFDGAEVPQDGNDDGIVATDRGAYEEPASAPVVTPPTSSPTPTPTPMPGPTLSPEPSASPSASATPTASPSPLPTVSPSVAPTANPTSEPAATASPTLPTSNPISPPTPAVLVAAFPPTGGTAQSGSSAAATLLLGGALTILIAAICDIVCRCREDTA